ncbi:MAG TPA: class I SAM-dependent methyltransferase [Thermoanaerobaculia bacterium]|nr:class I SAM-dependent methyltransferase [Thermoanaerobaculia bacterium]
MSQGLFLDLLDRGITDARIRFNVAGKDIDVGRGANGNGDHPDVVVRVSDPRMFTRSLAAGSLGMAESFMDGDFAVENDALPQFLEILLRNRLEKKVRSHPKLALRIGWMRLLDTIRGKAANVQHHYDLGDDLFEAFLDRTLTYSCGYALDPGDDLDTLQQNKLERICRKLRLRAGDRLLDIGCGFGGLLLHAAKYHGVTATGVTLAKRHRESGNERIAREGLQDRVQIEYADFNEVKGEFDRVVSVGMLEHVPRREYGRYFGKIAAVLAPDGVGLVHVIGANAPKNEHDPFIARYVFRNANQPKLSEIAHGLEQKGLAILDVENMIRHYHYTAKGWLKNFRRNRARLDIQKYDATFQKMWEFYLSAGVAAAKASDAALYQVLFMKDYTAPMPLHRV